MGSVQTTDLDSYEKGGKNGVLAKYRFDKKEKQKNLSAPLVNRLRDSQIQSLFILTLRPMTNQRFGKYWKGYIGAISIQTTQRNALSAKQEIYTHRKIIEPLDGNINKEKSEIHFKIFLNLSYFLHFH